MMPARGDRGEPDFAIVMQVLCSKIPEDSRRNGAGGGILQRMLWDENGHWMIGRHGNSQGLEQGGRADGGSVARRRASAGPALM